MDDNHRFQSLVASISSALVHARPATIDDVICSALKRIGEALDGNRVLLGQTNEITNELIAPLPSTAPPTLPFPSG